jgi:hypothetical protein
MAFHGPIRTIRRVSLALLVLLALRGLFEVRRRLPIAAEPRPAGREVPPA